MKLVIAQMKHETNTFSPVATPFAAFGRDGAYFGSDAYDALLGTATPMGAFLDRARKLNAELVTPVAGEASPSGPVAADAYTRMCDAICAAVAGGCDALLLDLHGAMVVDNEDDGEGALLARVRQLAPRVPIAVALDLHANLTQRMVDNATVIVGYKTYPHVDTYEAGDRAGFILLQALKGHYNPTMAWGNRPMLPHTLRMGTDDFPMRNVIAAARDVERAGALAASAFGGFPMADFQDAGLSAVVLTDGDFARAEVECKRILDTAWALRSEFVYRSEPLQRSLERAREHAAGPVLLLDHADNTASGGTTDVMRVLEQALAQGLTDIGVGPVRDPQSVALMIEAGIGTRVTLPIGGKVDMPAIGLKGRPLELSGVVRNITNGEYTMTGPQFTGMRCFMGRSAVLDTGVAQLVVTERAQEPWDLGVFESVGIDPRRKRFLLLKSRMYYRPVFLPIARAAIDCDGGGVTSSDYTLFNFRKVRRPIYPLDDDATVLSLRLPRKSPQRL